MNAHNMNSPAWIFFCYASFGIAIGTTMVGIWAAELEVTMKGFLLMGLLFVTGSAFTLAKTLRDEHEAKRLHHRLDEAKAERLLRESEMM